MVEPMYSPWGTVDHCKMLCYGAFEVQTARHGGVMILRELADEYLSKEAQAVGFVKQFAYSNGRIAILLKTEITTFDKTYRLSFFG